MGGSLNRPRHGVSRGWGVEEGKRGKTGKGFKGTVMKKRPSLHSGQAGWVFAKPFS